MTKVSKSPQRHTFQKEGYIKRQQDKGEPVNEDYLEYFQKILEQDNNKFNDPESRVNNLEYDLLTNEWILEKVRGSDAYAQNLYAAMCNNDFTRCEVIPILKEERWSCSWRYAGGIVADMRQEGDYIDWYCSGIRDIDHNEEVNKQWDERRYVAESAVTDEIKEDLAKLGWIVITDTKD